MPVKAWFASLRISFGMEKLNTPCKKIKLSWKKSSKNKGLAMKYLKKVCQGDKRIIVANGRVVGATLKTPKEGSWLCSLARGGSSSFAKPDELEIRIAETISPVLTDKGIVFFGFDTLVDDDGHRVLSEINTLNVGLLSEAELYSVIASKTSNLKNILVRLGEGVAQ